jgi:hypothetical protein
VADGSRGTAMSHLLENSTRGTRGRGIELGARKAARASLEASEATGCPTRTDSADTGSIAPTGFHRPARPWSTGTPGT